MAGPSHEEQARRAELRTATLRLMIAVAAVHGIAIALYYAMDIADAAVRPRTVFVALWTFTTALTVAFLLRRVRAARRLKIGRR